MINNFFLTKISTKINNTNSKNFYKMNSKNFKIILIRTIIKTNYNNMIRMET
jgi:hypothetical protein